ncbi:MAG TPA: ABC transporter substrate-binding protein [Acidimicrobiia bacterium]|nr:ABC transporter substrate-binding protein [Acidimicrobiia bacterium]
MKRLRWLALVAVLALVAAACGDAEPAETTAAPTDTTEASTPPETEPPSDTTAPTDTEPDGELASVAAESCDYGGKIQSVEATGTHEVVYTLCSPDPAFLAKLAFVPFAVQPAEHLEATGGAPLENPIGTGPFMIDVWDRGSEIVMSRNPDYWGEAPAFDTLVFRWAAESTSRILELQSGSAHYITNLAASDYETIEGDENLQLLEDPNPNVFYIGLTTTHAPFDDVRVRQAVAMGIDRQRIIDNFYPEGSIVPTHFTPCVIPNGCEGEEWYEFDPEGAQALLEEAGFPDGFDTTVRYRDVFRVYLPEPGSVATEIATQLQENLGINATVEEMESGAFIEESSVGGLDGIHLLGWGADYPHVTNFLDTHFRGPQFGEPIAELVDLLDQGAAIVDEAEAAPVYEQANNLLKENVPMVPIATGAAADAALASLGNAAVPPFGAPQFAAMDPGSDTLVFIQNAEPISMFCHDETDGESLSACEQVLEGLYAYDLDGEVVPALAESCEPNEDGTVWTCSIRQGVTFHDGSELDANDVVTSFAVGIDASNPLHVGNTGGFEYYAYLWGGLMNDEG